MSDIHHIKEPLDIESISSGVTSISYYNHLGINIRNRSIEQRFMYINIKARRLNKSDPFTMAIDKLFGDK